MAFRESTGVPVGGAGGIMMSADGGPMMSGTWVNPQTGHRFTVADCFFQDGNFVVKTTDGRLLDYNTIQHYVQTTDKGPLIGKQPQHPVKKQNPQPAKENIPDEIMNEILPEDMEAIGLGNINQTRPEPMVQPKPVDPDVAMIEKVLKKHPAPKPSISIDWQPVPRKQIETLVEVLGVEPQAIADYYIAMLDTTSLMSTVKDAIISCVNSLVGEEPAEAIDIEIVTEEPAKEPVKKQTKKTTKKSKK